MLKEEVYQDIEGCLVLCVAGMVKVELNASALDSDSVQNGP